MKNMEIEGSDPRNVLFMSRMLYVNSVLDKRSLTLVLYCFALYGVITSVVDLATDQRRRQSKLVGVRR